MGVDIFNELNMEMPGDDTFGPYNGIEILPLEKCHLQYVGFFNF
jgi:hypothetical protein